MTAIAAPWPRARPGAPSRLAGPPVPIGIGDIATIDAAEMLRTLHTYQLGFRDTTLIRDGVESRPSMVDPRRGDIVRPTR